VPNGVQANEVPMTAQGWEIRDGPAKAAPLADHERLRFQLARGERVRDELIEISGTACSDPDTLPEEVGEAVRTRGDSVIRSLINTDDPPPRLVVNTVRTTALPRSSEERHSERYAREKLAVALDCLAVSAAPIQHRLANAAISALHRLTPADFADPDDGVLLDEIKASFRTHKPRGSVGSIEASTHAMDDETAVALARKIAELHARVMPLS
jgi:hypothetical protein